jgi:PhoH-like ATPase
LLLSNNKPFPGLHENEFLVLEGGHTKQFVKGKLKNITFNTLSKDSGIKALNVGQKMYINILLDNNITVVSATGIAGSGKTLLPLAAAIDALDSKQIAKIYLTRPAVGPNGTGFKPGSSKDKVMGFMRPFISNLQTLLEATKSEQRKKLIKKLISEVNTDQKDLDSPMIEVLPLEEIGGITIENAWLMGDEFQNSDQELMMLVLGRMGKNSKIILSGDPVQTVNALGVTAHTNGLTILISQLLDQPLVGHINLEVCERSDTAALVGLFNYQQN